ncbi:hypothetical protein VXS06_01830 [Photobacterium toruni]|uniref:Uncharacterized protein n=1 Tax=Photobacterium toruni TaxID=1935446 RepID=A0ABU6L1Y0_9GAMM|nr:hypothetical protein [Photobacterium toruni]
MEFLGWVVSGGLGGGAVSFILKSWFENRLKNSIKHEYDKRLLELKASIEKESNLVSTLQSNFSHKNNVSHERILGAIESLWSGILSVRKSKPSILTFVDVLVEREFGTDFGTHENENIIDITDSDISAFFSDEINNKSQDRLYAGEYLWSLFSSYRQLVGRISVVIKKGREAQDVPLWWEDSICQSVIQSLCSSDDLDEFNSLKFNRINWILNHIEHKYLKAANQIVTGEASIGLEAELSSKMMQTIEKNAINKNL